MNYNGICTQFIFYKKKLEQISEKQPKITSWASKMFGIP